MMGFAIVGLVVFAVVIGLVFWGLARGMDKDRITSYIQERGGRVVSIHWNPFGKGWFGEKNDRIYEVVYIDSAGNEHEASCKTSMWSGVYWTEDRVTGRRSRWGDSQTPSEEPPEALAHQLDDWEQEDQKAELERLREENERLRGQLRRTRKEAGQDDHVRE